MHHFLVSSYWDKPKPHDFFFEKLYVSVQDRDDMRKLTEINEYVKITRDKLPGIGMI